MGSGAGVHSRSPLVSLNRVIDPHFVTFYSSFSDGDLVLRLGGDRSTPNKI